MIKISLLYCSTYFTRITRINTIWCIQNEPL